MSETNDIEKVVANALAAADVQYELMPCDPDLADTALFCERYGIPPAQSANAIIVASKKEPKQYSANLVLSTTRLDVNRRVRELMGTKRLSFASAEETVELTGMMVGGVTPFGLNETIPVFVDSNVMDCEWIVIGGGSRSSKIKLSPGELKKLSTVKVVEGLAKKDGE